jgi:hypothetical protein
VPDFSKELASETAQLRSRPNASAQQMASAAGAEVAQRAAASKRGMEEYVSKIRVKVRGNIVLPPNIQGNPEAVFVVEQLPGGEILNVRLKRSSGSERQSRPRLGDRARDQEILAAARSTRSRVVSAHAGDQVQAI